MAWTRNHELNQDGTRDEMAKTGWTRDNCNPHFEASKLITDQYRKSLDLLNNILLHFGALRFLYVIGHESHEHHGIAFLSFDLYGSLTDHEQVMKVRPRSNYSTHFKTFFWKKSV